MVYAFLFLLSIFLLFAVIVMCLEWVGHVKNSLNNVERYGWSSYKRFRMEYEKYEWKTKDDIFRKTLQSRDGNHYIKSDGILISFFNTGMIINNPFSYFLVQNYINNQYEMHKKKIYKREKIKW